MVYAANGREIANDNDDLVSTNYNVDVSYEYFLQTGHPDSGEGYVLLIY